MRIEDIKVGMVIKRSDSRCVETVLFMGNESLFLCDSFGTEWSMLCDELADYHEVKTYPEFWINVYPDRIGVGHPSDNEAVKTPFKVVGRAVARIHLATDGTLTLVDL